MAKEFQGKKNVCLLLSMLLLVESDILLCFQQNCWFYRTMQLIQLGCEHEILINIFCRNVSSASEKIVMVQSHSLCSPLLYLSKDPLSRKWKHVIRHFQFFRRESIWIYQVPAGRKIKLDQWGLLDHWYSLVVVDLLIITVSDAIMQNIEWAE